MDGVKFSVQMDGCFFFPAALSFFLSFFLRMSTRTWKWEVGSGRSLSLPPLPPGLVYMYFCFVSFFQEVQEEGEEGEEGEGFIVLGGSFVFLFWGLTVRFAPSPSLSLMCFLVFLGSLHGFSLRKDFSLLYYIYLSVCVRGFAVCLSPPKPLF